MQQTCDYYINNLIEQAFAKVFTSLYSKARIEVRSGDSFESVTNVPPFNHAGLSTHKNSCLIS